MSSSTDTTSISGAWNLDQAHSTAAFSVNYMGVTTFRSEFKEFSAGLEIGDDGAATLTGTVQVASIAIDIPQFRGSVMGEEFFAVESHPEVSFTSSSVKVSGDDVEIEGDLTIKGTTRHVVGKGEISGPVEDFMNNTRVGLKVEAKIDRTAFGLNWNTPLPKGGFALADEVTLELDLFFVKA